MFKKRFRIEEASYSENVTCYYVLQWVEVQPLGTLYSIEWGPFFSYSDAVNWADANLYEHDVLVGTTIHHYYSWDFVFSREEEVPVYYTYGYSYIEPYSYLQTRYDLGSGWGFNFPSVEIINEDKQYLYFHDGNGGTYEIDTTYSSGSNLKNYQEKDVKFIKDNGTFVNDNGIASNYVFISSDQKKTYFASDGRLLGIVDRLGNKIKFSHINRNINGKSYPFISCIIDSIGRSINFNYSPISSGIQTLTVTVNDPNNSKSLSITYEIAISEYKYYEYGRLLDTWNMPLLNSVKNPNNEITYFSYLTNGDSREYDIKFLFDTKDISSNYAYTSACLLNKVEMLNHNTFYNYKSINRNLGPEGACNSFRVSSRYDVLNTSDGSTNQVNKVDYKYTNDSSGYISNFDDDEALPSSYSYGARAIKPNDNSYTTYTYNGLRQHISTDYVVSNGERKRVKNRTFDTTFSFKPTLIEMADFDAAGNSYRLYVGNTYNEWGGLAGTTQPLPYDQLSNTVTREKYTTKYQYHPTFKFVTEKSYYQNYSDSLPLKETFIYDDQNGRLKSMTNAANETINYFYSTSSEGDKIETTKNLENGKIAKTEIIFGVEAKKAFPTKIRSFYTNENNVVQETKVTKTYNLLLGLVSSETDNNNNSTTYSYDNLGRILSMILPDISDSGIIYSVERKFEYSNRCLPSLADAPDNTVYTTRLRSYEVYTNKSNNTQTWYNLSDSYYNAFGNLIIKTFWDYQRNAWIKEARYGYDNMSRPISYKDSMDNSSKYSYSSWGTISEVCDLFGNIYKTDYDIIKRKITNYMIVSDDVAAFRTNPSNDSLKNNVLDTFNDYWGRAYVRKVYPNWPDRTGDISEQFTYDLIGNKKTYIDSKYYTTTYNYDKLQRLTQVIDPLNQTTEYSYNALGKLKNIKQSDGTKTWITSKEYDELGNQIKNIDPGSIAEKYIPNALGQIVKRIDPNQIQIDYTFDNSNRLSTKSAGGSSFKYSYGSNPFGLDKIEEYSNDNFVRAIEYSHLPNGIVSETAVNNEGYTSITSNSYDLAGKLTSVQSPFSFYTHYSYDKIRINKVQTNGLLQPDTTGQAYANYEYYDDGKLKTITYPKLNDGSYLKTCYEYDKVNRLIRVSNLKNTQVISKYNYTYDKNGNIDSITDASGITIYRYDKLNRLTEIIKGGKTIKYSYDVRGNRKIMEQTSLTSVDSEVYYKYNVWNQLTEITKESLTITYQYDPSGLRIKKTSPTETVRYHYNSDQKVIAESDESNNVIANYVWGPDRVLAKKEATGAQYYYLYNGHGDVTQIIDSNGNVVNQYQYDEWGNITNQTEGIRNPFKYAGEIFDAETGLYYLRARYYDPTTGRFISKDTYEGKITNPLTLNLYTYGLNNPIIYIDPSGHVVILVHGILANNDKGQLEGPMAMQDYLAENLKEEVIIYNWTKYYTNGGAGNVAAAWGNNSKVPSDLASFIQKNYKKGEPLNIVAHSGGGQMSLEAAILIHKNNANIKINNLVLLDAPVAQVDRPSNVNKIYLSDSWHWSSIGSIAQSTIWKGNTYKRFGWVAHWNFWQNKDVQKWVLKKIKST